MGEDLDDGVAALSVTGGCLCAAVSYRITGPLREVVACHCQQCRRSSGHHAAATATSRAALEIEGEVRWFRSSKTAARGFCPICGSNLFWDGGGPRMAIFAGTLDPPSGLVLDRHIFCAEKGDYYGISDGRPQFPGAES